MTAVRPLYDLVVGLVLGTPAQCFILSFYDTPLSTRPACKKGPLGFDIGRERAEF